LSQEKSSVGRPKNEAASTALKEVALNLVMQKGYDAVSITEIVNGAGVSRQTLYNRWATKAELVLDAFFELANRRVEMPDLKSQTSRQTLLSDFLKQIFLHLEKDGDSLGSFVSAAQSDHDFREKFYTRFVAPRADIVRKLLKDAQSRGELAPDKNIELWTAFIHGAFWYRLINGQPIPQDLANEIAEEVFR
tara:strand:- start:89303 stop:89878 length:576 start_codon:yes stop_codon:yes gene_type:complete